MEGSGAEGHKLRSKFLGGGVLARREREGGKGRRREANHQAGKGDFVRKKHGSQPCRSCDGIGCSPWDHTPQKLTDTEEVHGKPSCPSNLQGQWQTSMRATAIIGYSVL